MRVGSPVIRSEPRSRQSRAHRRCRGIGSRGLRQSLWLPTEKAPRFWRARAGCLPHRSERMLDGVRRGHGGRPTTPGNAPCARCRNRDREWRVPRQHSQKLLFHVAVGARFRYPQFPTPELLRGPHSVVEEIAAQRKKLIRSGKTSARRFESVTAHRVFQPVFVQDELKTPCKHGGDLRRPFPGYHLLDFVALEDGEVYVKVSLEQGAPFETCSRSLTLDECKPGCADVFQPSGVPKVAVLVGSDEREVQI